MRKVTALLTASCAAIASMVAVGAAPAGAKEDPNTGVIVFNGQGNDLDAYSAEELTPGDFRHQTVIRNREDDPKGYDINAQICFFGDDNRTFIAGEDTGQPDPVQGWGIFRLKGKRVGKLKARQIGKLQPTYQGSGDNAENYGCGILSDGRVVTTDIGNQATGPGDGQLIIWFPPLDAGFEKVRNGTVGNVPYCKLDIGIATAGGIAVDDQDRLYVASARGDTVGVWRYAGPFPTSADASGGCDGTDSTGAPMATNVTKERFIAAGNDLGTPNAIVRSRDDKTWFVSSVFTGVINEYDDNGQYLRTVLRPPAGETVGPEPLSTGSPLGIGIGPDGTIYFADIGLVANEDGIGPGDRTGALRRIRFVDGEPQPPETMADDLAFPDGIGVYIPAEDL